MAQKAMGKGSALPPLEKGKIRLYSMRFCPFAQRARIVLGHYNIPFEVVNIDLKSKPEWLLERNPNGSVPVYEKDCQVLYESIVVSDYIDEVYGNGQLYPKDPYLKAKAKILIEQISKVVGLISKAYMMSPAEFKEQVPGVHAALQSIEDRLDNKFLMGSSVTMPDYILWPHIERTVPFGHVVQADLLPEDKFPNIHAWKTAMLNTPGVRATIIPSENHIAFLETMKSGAPNFDYGL